MPKKLRRAPRSPIITATFAAFDRHRAGIGHRGAGLDLSLREVARRAGVSHYAPYNHFPEKRIFSAPSLRWASSGSATACCAPQPE